LTVDARRRALVTGASSGIGRAIAVALGALGWRVALGARRVDALEETAALVRDAGGEPFVHPLDVVDGGSIDEFVGAATRALGPVDVLVNNAGTALPGAIEEMADEVHARIIATNLLGPILITKRVVADLLQRGVPGDIVFISSDATRHPRPHLLTYGASKAGLEAVAHTLALEVEGSGIRTTIVRVGPTLTGFGEGWDPEQFESLIPRWQRFGIQRHWNTLQPSDVAAAVVAAVTMPPHAHLPEIEVQPICPPPT
jgi:NAD(P)-dependent dehydrogenase (short-subunit alcohol dehydrogenase family)